MPKIGWPWRRGAGRDRPARRARAGITLLELLIITVMLGIVALIAAGFLREAREDSMMAATRTSLRHAMRAIDMYETVYGTLPATLLDLRRVDFAASRGIEICTFRLVRDGGEDAYVEIRAQHRGAAKSLESRYPSWGLATRERPRVPDCDEWTSRIGAAARRQRS